MYSKYSCPPGTNIPTLRLEKDVMFLPFADIRRVRLDRLASNIPSLLTLIKIFASCRNIYFSVLIFHSFWGLRSLCSILYSNSD